jgi:hypothetical protein
MAAEEGHFDLDQQSQAAAIGFARSASIYWTSEMGARIRGAYLIGSLAHGGYSRSYSDIDLALVMDNDVDAAAIDEMRFRVKFLSVDLASRLSIFWTDCSFSSGRFPVLDRVDYLDHATGLIERGHRVFPQRPSLGEVRSYLRAETFPSWARSAEYFSGLHRLEAKDHKRYLRTLLYPARLVYSWMTGCIASNDAAVAFLAERELSDFDADAIERALEIRRASREPDSLFAARAVLPRQVEACAKLMAAN